MQDACGELARYADTLGAHFAVETGPEPASVLCRFLDGLHSSGVSVNLDPANLVMVNRDDPVAAVHTLKKYIVHTHAKDGRQLHECDPEVVYGVRPRDPDCVTDKSFIELPLGEGDVPFPAYLKALEDVGYRGFLTIEREVGEQYSVMVSSRSSMALFSLGVRFCTEAGCFPAIGALAQEETSALACR